ncbi:MAG: type VI secretion system baseplate subunit TssG [Lacipirellulaceae bacterium]
MADPDRTPPHLVKLLEELRRNPHGFDFFQAVRLLDCAHPDKPQTGRGQRCDDDAVRIEQEASMAFAPSTLSKADAPSAGRPWRLVQSFFGLLGPNGPLPMHLTEYTRDRRRDRGDETFLHFLNVFHHRMAGFFYRAWARVRPTVSHDQPSADRFSEYVGSLFGLGMPSLRGRDAFPDLPKRHFAGLLSCQARHAEGLEAILSGYFCFPVRVEEFVGQWVEVPGNSRCFTGQASAVLGVETIVGSHFWDCQQKFRVVIGPLTLEDYKRMLPGGAADGADRRESLATLVAAVRTYVGDELDWDLQLVLRKEEVPPSELGSGACLGWTSWMPSPTTLRDADDLVLHPLEMAYTG